MNQVLRGKIRHLLLDVLGVASTPKRGIHILNGHMISRENPSAEIFFKQLSLLQRHVTFIKIEDAIELISKRQKVNDVLVSFTFDDGFEECYSMIAPTLESFGANAMFFINPNFVEADEDYIKNFTEITTKSPGKKPMNWSQIIELSRKGHKIGAHTLDHYLINDNNFLELERQIGTCRGIIEKKIGAECPYFAFPYGRLEHANPASIEIARKYYPYVFSQSDYKNYFSYNGQVINRRHFEPDWPVSHVNYFLSHERKY